jgi:flagellin
MSVINTNVNALFAQSAMKTNAREMSSAMQQLSTGNRINSAKDDSAGLAITQSMTSQVRGLNQAVRNANDGINMLQTADGALVESSNMLQRMRELSVQAANGTYSSTQRGYMKTEFDELSSQIDDISADTEWNSLTLLAAASSDFDFQVGQDADQTITVTIGAMTVSALSASASFDISISFADLAAITSFS